MGFLGRAVGTALLGPGGYALGNQFDQSKGGGPSGPAPWNPITAKNTTISPDLAATMGTIGTTAYNNIGTNYAGAKTKLANDASARGMNGVAATAPNSYAGQRLATTQGLDTGNLESAIGGQIGSTAYQNALQNRDYNQGLSLADETARLNKPSILDQIFQGIGAVGKPIATYAGARGRGGSGGNSYSGGDPMAGAYGNV